MSRKSRGNLLLLITAFIWGSSFVAQSAGMEYLGPFTFTSVRMLIGGIVLIPIIYFMKRFGQKETSYSSEISAEPGILHEISEASADSHENPSAAVDSKKTLWIAGLICGGVLFFSSSTQQIGIIYTTAGKAGFITALYIILVPIFGLFLGIKIRKLLWFCVLLAMAGLYLLCIKEGFSIGKGDLIVLLCAPGYAVHILVINHFASRVDGVKLSCIQFLVCGLLALPPALILEHPQVSEILLAWLPLLYASILSCGVGFTFQIIAQKDTDPTITSLILSMESVFAALTGFIILHEILSHKELVGCALMFMAIILAQLPAKQDAKVSWEDANC